MKSLFVLAGAFALAACGNNTPPGTTTPVPSAAPAPAEKTSIEPPPPATPPKPLDLKGALAVTIPEMEDVRDAVASKGGAIFAMWAASEMKWSELQALEAAKYAMVMKDSVSERGKRICTTGRIIEIAVDRTAGKPLYFGGMYDEAGKLYRFIAVGSTGALVESSRAKFCGVVVGQQHYQNSAGGVAHSVQLVGMFDLPENRTR